LSAIIYNTSNGDVRRLYFLRLGNFKMSAVAMETAKTLNLTQR
jgi:hypothetical protein